MNELDHQGDIMVYHGVTAVNDVSITVLVLSVIRNFYEKFLTVIQRFFPNILVNMIFLLRKYILLISKKQKLTP